MVDFLTYYSDSEDDEIEEKRDIYSNDNIFVSDVSDVKDKLWNLFQDMSVNVSNIRGDSIDSVSETPHSIRGDSNDMAVRPHKM